MKKRILAALLASAAVLSVAGCGGNTASTTTAAATQAAAGGDTTTAAADNGGDTTTAAAPAGNTDNSGTTFNIYAWNDEFKGFFEKYMPGLEERGKDEAGNPLYSLDGIPVNWIITPSADMAYQNGLDSALPNNASASADDKVDMFLAEADYILKYVDSDYTLDISTLGVNQVPTEYQYTVDAASDSNGKIKGVSFQCCPSALIYRRSIAKDVLGTDDPDEVQAALDSWDKYDAVAATAKDKGYYMHASFAETYRVFSNNATSPWVTNGELTMPDAVKQWTKQAKDYFDKGYIVSTCPGIWDADKNLEMKSTGKAMCFFGPAWYFNFCMKDGDNDLDTVGDWAICKGPQAHFWGGTWILAATGTDNGDLVAKVMKAFTENEEVCENLIKNESQFTNNSAVNEKFAADPTYGNNFLGGQNDVAVFVGLAGDIKWENATIYDQACNEGYQDKIKEYILGTIDEETALQNFYEKIRTDYPAVTTP